MAISGVPNMNKINTYFSGDKDAQNLWKNFHNYLNLAWSLILFYLHQHPIVSDHGTTYEKKSIKPSSDYRGICEDRQTGPDSAIAEWWIIGNKKV